VSVPAAQFVANLPFNRRIGLGADDEGRVLLEDDATLHNHVGTLHAGALFTLGEAASGVAIGPIVEALGAMPIAKKASIEYLRKARGRVRAEGRVGEAIDAIRARLEADGRTTFDVDVELRDDAGTEVAHVVVTWHLRAA
jgi:acyl-coenzyme A thioesterase PaaI-like protein